MNMGSSELGGCWGVLQHLGPGWVCCQVLGRVLVPGFGELRVCASYAWWRGGHIVGCARRVKSRSKHCREWPHSCKTCCCLRGKNHIKGSQTSGQENCLWMEGCGARPVSQYLLLGKSSGILGQASARRMSAGARLQL